MTMVAGSMDNGFESLKDIVTSAFGHAPRSADFEIQAKAIEAIENDEGLSDEGIKDAALVIANDPSVANLYLTIKSERARKIFLLEKMEGLRK
jgi:hypothetical protein